MKRVISALLALIVLVPLAARFPAAAEESGHGEYIKDIEETVIEIDGLTERYNFLHITDSHCVVVSNNTSSYYYSESIQRYNHFMNPDNGSNGYPAVETLNAMYAYADDPANDIDCVWLSGDIIDFPSAENVSYITNLVTNASVDRMYCFGNHDWTYPQKYFTTEGRNNFRPLLKNAMGGNNLYSYRDYGAFVVVTIDNSENYIYYSAVADFIRNTIVPLNKPVILFCHVPFYNSALAAYAKNTWGTDETMASPSNTKYPYNAATKYIYEWATTNSKVKAIFCGHFHYNYEGYTGRTPIYMTESAYSGTMRHILVKPTSCAVHTWDAGETVTPATSHPGVFFHTCTVCGDSEYIELPPICTLGDIDGDDGVDMADALIVKRHIARVDVLTDAATLIAADVNEDGRINAKDSLMLRKFIAGVVNSLGN